MFDFKRQSRQGDVLHDAYNTLPRARVTPREAFERLQAGTCKQTSLIYYFGSF